MDDEEYRKKKLIKDVVDNKLFDQIIGDIRSEMAEKMLNSEKEDDRVRIHQEAKALDHLVGHLTAIANEVRMING